MFTQFYIQSPDSYVKLKSLLKKCWFWSGIDGHIVGFGAEPKGRQLPKGAL